MVGQLKNGSSLNLNYNKKISGDIKIADTKVYGVALEGMRLCHENSRVCTLNYNQNGNSNGLVPVMIDKNNNDALDNGYITITSDLVKDIIGNFHKYNKMRAEEKTRGLQEKYARFGYLNIENIYVVYNYREKCGQPLQAFIVCEDKIILIALEDRIGARITNTSAFEAERNRTCYPACIISKDADLKHLFIRSCYVTPKKGKKYENGRHLFVVGNYVSTAVFDVKANNFVKLPKDVSREVYENSFAKMDIGKYLYARKNNLQASAVKQLHEHHEMAQWDERFIRVVSQQQHSSLHQKKTIHRIHVQIATKDEMIWFMRFINNDNNMYSNIINGLLQIDMGKGNVQKSTNVHNYLITANNLMQREIMRKNVVTILTEWQYRGLRSALQKKYNVPDMYMGC